MSGWTAKRFWTETRVDVDDGRSVEGAFVRLGAPARGVDRLVLEEEHSVGELARDDLLVHGALKLPAGEVFDSVAAAADLAAPRGRRGRP